MKEIAGLFDLEPLSEPQKKRMHELLHAAERSRALRQPGEFNEHMQRAYSYYLSHHPEKQISPDKIALEAEKLAAALPGVKKRHPASMNIWKGALMIMMGVAGAFGFLYLYFNPRAPQIPKVLLFAALLLFTGFVIAIPVLFNTRGGHPR